MMEIVELDPYDDAAFGAWHAAYLEAELAAGDGVAAPFQLEEFRPLLQDAGIRYAKTGWSGLVEGRVVTVGFLRAPLMDNTDRAEIDVHTVPGARRRGYGTAMLAQVERAARELGRSIIVGESVWSYDAGPDGAGVPGREFAVARGYELALGDVKRRLDLPVADDVLDALETEIAPYLGDFELRSFAGPVPDDLLESWARLVASLMVEAPVGDLEVEAETADPAAVRESEAMIAKQGRAKYNSVALDAAGEVVAYSDLATTIHEPGRSYQWGTLVRRDARGHRLGLAVKIANLRLLQRERPDIREVVTYNAEVNAHMIGVNERLGFRPVARLGEFQKKV